MRSKHLSTDNNDQSVTEKPNSFAELKKKLILFEDERAQTFVDWQYDENEKCSVLEVNHEY
jgi:hypothetical protein